MKWFDDLMCWIFGIKYVPAYKSEESLQEWAERVDYVIKKHFDKVQKEREQFSMSRENAGN